MANNPIYAEKPFDKTHAWIDIILSANSKPADIKIQSQKIHIDRGSFFVSIRKLSQRWGWTYSKCYRTLERWKKHEMICVESIINPDREPDHLGVVITVINYSKYNEEKNVTGLGAGNKQYIYKNIYRNPSLSVDILGLNCEEFEDESEDGMVKKNGEEKQMQSQLNDWQMRVGVANHVLMTIDKLGNGDPPFCAKLIKTVGFIMAFAKLERISATAGTFKSPEHAKAYIMAACIKHAVSNTYDGGGDDPMKRRPNVWDLHKDEDE